MRRWLCRMLGGPELREPMARPPREVREMSHELRNQMTQLDAHIRELRGGIDQAIVKFESALTAIKDSPK